MSRFESHLKKNLVKINKNLYVSESDSLYYEKILRYTNSHSPEAHYRQGQKLEEEGEFLKALIHYHEAIQQDSPYYFKAKHAIILLEEKINSLDENQQQTIHKNTPLYTKALIAFLVFLSIILLVLLFWKPTVNTIASTVKQWTTGKEVVYESVDVPYVLYIPVEMTYDEIEKTIYEKALHLGNELQEQTLLLYGVLTTDQKLSLQVLPLRNEKLTNNAVVMAEYNSAFDQTVKIRFFNHEFKKELEKAYPSSFSGTNIVRTALQAYIQKNGISPTKIEELVNDYPDNYLSFIPNEAFSQSNQVLNHFDGKGGWVYKQEAKQIADMFYPNVPGYLDNATFKFPFNPIEVIVEKETFSLLVMSPPFIIFKKPVGLGQNNSTPEGLFSIDEKVLDPKGETPNMFGVAGLGMGDIAIHGTVDESSIHNEKSLGCIRLTNEDIQDIFNLIPKGTVVKIIDKAPSINSSVLNNPIQLVPSIIPPINQKTDQTFYWSA